MAEVALEIPPRSVYVGVIRLAVASLARGDGLDEELVDDLKIAVSEACTNAVLSSAEAGSNGPIRVVYHDEPDRLVVDVEDHGISYDEVAKGSSPDSQGYSTRLMMSMAMLEALVDGCEFSPLEGGGLLTRLTVGR